MADEPEKQVPKQLAPFIWKKGQSGNPAGRPPGKTLKEFARDYLMLLPDDEKVDYRHIKNRNWKAGDFATLPDVCVSRGGSFRVAVLRKESGSTRARVLPLRHDGQNT
jgi:hypothetical protein